MITLVWCVLPQLIVTANHRVLRGTEIRSKRVPILFFANKKDIPGAASQVECAQALALDLVQDHAYHITYAYVLRGCWGVSLTSVCLCLCVCVRGSVRE